jgi:hypothetical protein
MNEKIESFLKRELRLRVLIQNLQCNLTFGAIVKLIEKYIDEEPDNPKPLPVSEDKPSDK